MESAGKECLSRPREQHRRQILHHGWDLPRRNGDHKHGGHAALGLPSRREPVVLAGRRRPANLGGAAHRHRRHHHRGPRQHDQFTTPRPPTTSVATPPTTLSSTPPNAAVQGHDLFKEVGGDDWFLGQAATELQKRKRAMLRQEDYHGALQDIPICSNPPRQALVRAGKPKWELAFRRQLDDHQQAIDHFSKAIEIKDNPVRQDKPSTFVHCNRSMYAHLSGHQTGVEHGSRISRRISHQCRSSRGTEYLPPDERRQRQRHRARESSAVPDGREAITQAEALATAHVSAGDSYTWGKQYARATHHYSQAIKLNDNAEARASRAWAYRSSQNCNDALTDAGEAIKLPPVSRHGYHSSAEAYWLFAHLLRRSRPAEQRST